MLGVLGPLTAPGHHSWPPSLYGSINIQNNTQRTAGSCLGNDGAVPHPLESPPRAHSLLLLHPRSQMPRTERSKERKEAKYRFTLIQQNGIGRTTETPLLYFPPIPHPPVKSCSSLISTIIHFYRVGPQDSTTEMERN